MQFNFLSPPLMRPFTTIATVVLILLSVGCVNSQVIVANSTPAVQAGGDIPEDELMDVGVSIFDPGVPEKLEETIAKLINPGVRKAEANYMPYTLKRTLEATGNWGAVRVTPRDASVVDLKVDATIEVSNGEELKLKVIAVDATGRKWLDESYEDVASKFAYESEVHANEDPFQDIYNEIANDLLAARKALSGDQLREIREISKLRFAADLSPDSFGTHLDTNKDGTYYIRRLPAENDPMLDRVEKILQREYMFIDVLDQHYAEFHEQIERPYSDWRRFSYDEVIALRALQHSSRMRKIMGAATIAGGIAMDRNSSTDLQGVTADAMILVGAYTFKTGMDKAKETKIHAESIRELAGSFSAEARPMVVDVQGNTVTLTGSADKQYHDWRELLRQIYESETGLPSLSRAPEESSPATTEGS